MSGKVEVLLTDLGKLCGYATAATSVMFYKLAFIVGYE
jgi:hypothetical protein